MKRRNSITKAVRVIRTASTEDRECRICIIKGWRVLNPLSLIADRKEGLNKSPYLKAGYSQSPSVLLFLTQEMEKRLKSTGQQTLPIPQKQSSLA